jgi:hypothetical protein
MVNTLEVQVGSAFGKYASKHDRERVGAERTNKTTNTLQTNSKPRRKGTTHNKQRKGR